MANKLTTEGKLIRKYVRMNKPSEQELIKKFGKKKVWRSYQRGDVYNSSLYGNKNAQVKVL